MDSQSLSTFSVLKIFLTRRLLRVVTRALHTNSQVGYQHALVILAEHNRTDPCGLHFSRCPYAVRKNP